MKRMRWHDRNAVLNLLRNNGIAVRHHPSTNAEKRRFAEEYKMGAEIAMRARFAFGTVQSALYATGVPMRPRGVARKENSPCAFCTDQTAQ